MANNRLKPIVVAGPTASGKTTLGIQLAKRFGGAVISADSRMVYRRLDIGTGKPTWEYRELDQSPWLTARESEFGPVYSIGDVDHYGLDLVRPQTPFSLTDWLAFARPLITQLKSDQIRPVIVGGTGLYLKSLLEGFQPPPTDSVIRAELDRWSNQLLFDELVEIDPTTAMREQANHRRLVRALEVVRLTGQPMSDQRTSEPFKATVIAPVVDRAALMQRIDQRLHERLEAGMIDEVRDLIASGVSEQWLRELGLEYRFVVDWLKSNPHLRSEEEISGENVSHFVSEEIMEEQLKLAIHRYAKRQLTYLRHQLPVAWVDTVEDAEAIVQT